MRTVPTIPRQTLLFLSFLSFNWNKCNGMKCVFNCKRNERRKRGGASTLFLHGRSCAVAWQSRVRSSPYRSFLVLLQLNKACDHSVHLSLFNWIKKGTLFIFRTVRVRCLCLIKTSEWNERSERVFNWNTTRTTNPLLMVVLFQLNKPRVSLCLFNLTKTNRGGATILYPCGSLFLFI